MKWDMSRKWGTRAAFPSRKGSHKRVHGHLVAVFAVASFFLALLNIAVILTPSRVVQATPTAPTFVGAGAGDELASTLTTALDCPYPGSLLANDLIILQVGARTASAANIGSIAGFTRLLPASGEDQNGNGRQTLWYRFASGAESGTLSVTLNVAADSAACRMYAFRGVVTSAFTEAATTANISSGSMNGPSVATTGQGRLAVLFSSLDQMATAAAMTGETGGDWTEPVAEYTSGIGSNFLIQAQTAAMQGGGTISGGTSSFGGGSDDGIGRAFALIGIDSAPSTDNISGWAWSDTGGWLSMNSSNSGAGGGTYGVDMDEVTKVITGYAWSDNQGWVCFGSSCASASCANGATTPGGGAPTAYVDGSNNLMGWAMICNLGAPNGWISLNSANAGSGGGTYGVVVNFGTGDFGGTNPFAWHGLSGGSGWGWIDLDDVFLTSGFEGSTPTCHDTLDNDADGGTDCGNAPPADDMCFQQTAFNCPAQETQCALLGRSGCCTNGVDDDDDDLIDCADNNCNADPACSAEICDNGMDDADADSDQDCDDAECASFPACTPAWIRANYSNIYSQQNIGGNAPPPGQSNATYCITSAGTISSFTSASGCTEPSSVPLSLPTGGNGYVSNIGRLDIAGTLAGRYGTVEAIASDAAIDLPLAGKVYVYDRDANGNSCPSAGPNGANTAFILNAKTFTNATGPTGRGNGLLIIKGCDLVINGNITYGAGNVSYLRNLASFGAVVLAKYSGGVPVNGGNLYIDDAVTQIVGLYFGERSVHTGSTGGAFTDMQLEVYGALVGRDMQLERQYGSPTEPAEEIIFDGRGVVNPPPGLQDITKSLPSAVGDTF